MTASETVLRRLVYQGLAQPRYDDPVEVVRFFGAVQSQDYAGAKWAVGQRLRGATDAALDAAFNDGAILRTHVLRPTWHFVTPEDIRWMLALTAPRINLQAGYYFRQLGLDEAVFAQSNAQMAKALEGGQQHTRNELADVLSGAGILTDNLLRLTHLMMRAELDAVICSGGRRGKQFTYALLDERAPRGRALERDEALAELARRYFTSHGPATLKDYAWWSGLTVTDARAGLEMVKPELIEEVIDGQSYYFADLLPVASIPEPTVYLLPNYDEFTVGYADRSGLMDMTHVDKFIERDSTLLGYTIVLDGQIVGSWKRAFKKSVVAVEVNPFITLSEAQQGALHAAVRRFGQFAGLPVASSPA